MASRSKATFQKRQKEMKRLEKQRMKADRRAQRSLAKRAELQGPDTDVQAQGTDVETPVEPELTS